MKGKYSLVRIYLKKMKNYADANWIKLALNHVERRVLISLTLNLLILLTKALSVFIEQCDSLTINLTVNN